MVGAAVEVLLPGPFILEGHQLVEVGAAVDHLLGVYVDACGRTFQLFQTFFYIQVIECGFGAGNGGGVRVIYATCLLGLGSGLLI